MKKIVLLMLALAGLVFASNYYDLKSGVTFAPAQHLDFNQDINAFAELIHGAVVSKHKEAEYSMRYTSLVSNRGYDFAFSNYQGAASKHFEVGWQSLTQTGIEC